MRALHRLGQDRAGLVTVGALGKDTRKVTSIGPIRLPSSSRTLSPPHSTTNSVGSARRVVNTSTSIAEHPAIAVSSSSTGVKSSSAPLPNDSVPPRALVAVNRPAESRVSEIERRASPGVVVMPTPCQ